MSDTLVFVSAACEKVISELLLDGTAVAVGAARINSVTLGRELLVTTLRRDTAWPLGSDEPPLSERVLVLTLNETDSLQPEMTSLIERLNPLPTQLWVILVLGLGEDRAGWRGAIIERGQVSPLLAMKVVGAGLLKITREPETATEADSAEEDLRWSRTRGALGADNVAKLRSTSAALLGAGRNGSLCAFQLAALGARRLAIVDQDRLEVENLDAMPGLTLADARRRRPKSLALARRLRAFRPDMALTALTCPVQDSRAIAVVRDVDVIFSCVDNGTPRLAAAILANRFGKVHVDVGTGITVDEHGERLLAGDVRLLLPHQGCVSCVGGLPDETDARYELFAPAGALKRSTPRAWNELRAGSLISLNSIACGIAVQLFLDLLGGRLTTSVWHRFRWIEGQGLQSDHSAVGRQDDCAICRPQ